MVTSLPPLVMRTDASRAIGTGHVMRCLALAQAWQDAGGHCLFACAEITPSLACRLHAENVEFVRMNAEAGSVADAVECSRLARERGAEWIVTDGYQFVSDYQAALKKSGLHLLLIDDYGHADPYDSADVVLNSNPCASAALYERRGAGTRLLLGGRYVLLRREFSRWRDWERIIAQGANKVLVTLGGADPRNVTSRVLRDLEPAGCECMAIVGGSNPHLQELESLAESLHRSRIAKDPGDITELMAWADLAVSSAGVTSLELAFMGLPTVLLTLAENQRLAAQALDESGVGIRLGVPEALSADAIASTVRGLLDDHPRRLRMSQAGQSLVDGRGAERVVEILAGPPLRLRRATEQDCRLLWEWANDPDTRANSFSSELIPWDDHQRWFRAKLSDPACLLL
ncbi:MAG: UDP-2,4-diacetamido-2,4,6-trideoxy-beta-L-altropyranose hydrolase, partial [Terriglobales bacterium]